jgi:DNA-binding winged helix-turn-helix (wHTH) protein
MDRVRAVGSARGVLVAVGDPIPLAYLFANAGFAPLLAFRSDQIVDFARTAEVVVTDDSVDPDGRMLQQAGTLQDTIRVFVTEPHRLAPPDVHAIVPPDLPPEEVLSRALTLLALRGERGLSQVLSWGPLRLDLARREARWRGSLCALTQTQFDILVTLVRAEGAVVSKVDLQKAIWPNEPPDAGERLVAHIRRIRSRIEEEPSRPKFLLTSRGIGFCLAQPDDVRDGDGRGVDRRPMHLRSVQGERA